MNSSVLVHSEYGVPEKVIQLSTYELGELRSKQVLVKVLASPINPADINMLEGKYLIQPELPCVLGNEGVGVIEAVGDEVENIAVGDRVIMPFSTDPWIGWWSEYFIANEMNVMVISDEIGTDQASMLTVNSVTAYQLLTRFVDVSRGDTIIQNAGNSGVGRWVRNIASKLGIRVISLVRNQAVLKELKKRESDHLFFLDEKDVSKQIEALNLDIQLALNGVGGQSAKELMKVLSSDGVMVTFGAMSKEPISVSNTALIYKNIWLTGFNRNKWIQEAPREEVLDTYQTVLGLIDSDMEDIPVEKRYRLDQASEAIKHASQESRFGKIIFDLA